MERQNREETPYLKEELLTHPRRYSFSQAVRLLRFFTDTPDDFSAYLKNHLRVKPLLSLGFPATDITDIKEEHRDDQPFFQITSTFLGL